MNLLHNYLGLHTLVHIYIIHIYVVYVIMCFTRLPFV